MPRVDVTLRGATDASPAPGFISTTTGLLTPTITTGGSTALVSTLMGMPGPDTNSNNHGYTTWDAWRVYSFAAMTGVLSLGCKTMGLTDNGTSVTGGSTAANSLRSQLMSFYGNTGAPSLHPTIKVHWANGNEIDRADKAIAPGSTTVRRNFVDTYEAMKAVTDDFDNASLWFDPTANQVRGGASNDVPNAPTWDILNDTGTAGVRLCDMLDGIAGSFYAPGRNDYPTMTAGSYTGNSAPSAIVDPYIELMGLAGVSRSSIWEVGIPMYATGHGVTVIDPIKRRSYIQSLAFYWFDRCLANGITPEIALYWDQQTGSGKGGLTNNNPDNRLATDNTLVTPSTATLWRTAATDYNASH